MKLSLKMMFLGLLFLAMISLVLLGSFALFFNHKLRKNQDYLLEANSIESSCFVMSSALSNFLARQSTILTENKLENISQVPSRIKIERQFSTGLDSLKKALQNSPEIKNCH